MRLLQLKTDFQAIKVEIAWFLVPSLLLTFQVRCVRTSLHRQLHHIEIHYGSIFMVVFMMQFPPKFKSDVQLSVTATA